MSMTLDTRARFSLEDAKQFLYREARYLDDRDWDAWLTVYADDVEFWMPSWDDDDKLIEDPQTEISLIWYGTRADWKTGCSVSGPNAPARRACRSRAPRTTSAISKFWSRTAGSRGCASIG
jgi:3-phenylpropionate/cinnamic acid dioxygenase small subunit